MNKDKCTIPKVTEEDLLQMFENEEVLRYYLSLKEAVIESRSGGIICWCDPRDLQLKESLELSGWKPRVVLKLVDDQTSSECGEFGFANKQIALDENCQNETDLNTGKDTRCEDYGMEKSLNDESFRCGLHGCNQTFTSLASYESHYQTSHNHVCAECKSSFVSDFLLDIHLQENHDSYFQILSPRIDMFRCLVPSCELKFRTPDLRKDHLVKVHKLPANFMFHKPIKTKPQKSKAKAKSTSVLHCSEVNGINSLQNSSSSVSQSSSPSHSMEVDVSGQPIPEASGATGKRGRGSTHRKHKNRMPQTVCFGRGSQRAFQNLRPRGRRPHWHQMGAMDVDTTVDIEKIDFTDVFDSLEVQQVTCGELHI